MSNINTLRVADDIKSKTSVYTPIIEAIVNSIHAIEETGNKNGKIEVIFEKSNIPTLDIDIKDVDFKNVKIIDNGIGFNETNLKSFDTFKSNHKYKKGGKGFGRFMFIKYFDNARLESIFNNNGQFKKRAFSFGKTDNIIENLTTSDTTDQELKTTLYLESLRKSEFPKELGTIVRAILEKLLVYFISYENLPQISISDNSGEPIILNEIIKDNKEIQLIQSKDFKLHNGDLNEKFSVKVFKIFSPNNQKSKIILTADSREVCHTNLVEYVPEFLEEFTDIENKSEKQIKRNFIIKAYVLSKYLNEQVNTERTDFYFELESELFCPFSRKDIELQAADIAKAEVSNDIESRREKTKKKVKEYLSNSPYYKEYEQFINWNLLPMNPTEENIESEFHSIKFSREKEAKRQINAFLKGNNPDIEDKINDLFLIIDQAKRSDLAHYVCLRKVFIDVLSKTLDINHDQKTHNSENLVHNIIFPTRKDTDYTKFKDHNLWILDERLSFTDYLRSDMPLSKEVKGRPDIISFDQRVAYRGDNDASNPITIFEFKKPGRHDFTSPNSSKKEDPYEQIIRYISEIKDKKVTSFNNREIIIGPNTPFFGYIIADMNKDVEKWLEGKGFRPLPNNQRWISYNSNYNLQLEFISWTQLVKDAEQRNNTFFHYLGI